jgi:hypothetical protein
MLLQRFTGQLPEWARRGHPVLRYELGRTRFISRRAAYTRIASIAILGVLLFRGGYALATNFFTNPPGQNLTESMIEILFWPTLVIQLLLQIAALALTVNLVTDQKRRQTWDNLRATEGGAALALRARWALVFYRLRGALAFVLLIRLVLIIGILFDLTAFQGRYIDLLINGVTPEVPPVVAALLLAFLMTAALLLPFTSLGLAASIGLMVSVTIQQRVYSVMTQVIAIALLIAMVVALAIGATQFVRGDLPLGDSTAWLLMASFGGFADWGLKYLHLGFYSEIWATIPYAIFLGIGLLILALAQSALAEWILALAIRRAERSG